MEPVCQEQWLWPSASFNRLELALGKPAPNPLASKQCKGNKTTECTLESTKLYRAEPVYIAEAAERVYNAVNDLEEASLSR